MCVRVSAYVFTLRTTETGEGTFDSKELDILRSILTLLDKQTKLSDKNPNKKNNKIDKQIKKIQFGFAIKIKNNLEFYWHAFFFWLYFFLAVSEKY